jgi:DNA-binding MarR family transcriptional regulator
MDWNRRRNPMNRRFYQLTLTDQGRSVTSRLVASMHTHHARLLDAMTQAERDALATGVAALLRAMGQTPPLGARFPTPATSGHLEE